jgi:hypothetical protein
MDAIMDTTDDAAPMPTQPEPLPSRDVMSMPLPQGVVDIDADDQENPILVSEYAKECYEYLWSLEPILRCNPNYMTRQLDINERMRAILIDWLVEVHNKFKLSQETLFLSTNIIDRFLSVENIERSRLQLVGVTAMLIASKYEEIYAPEVRDFIYITDNAYTRQDILQMENRILRALGFQLGAPIALHFLRRNSKV